MKVCEHKYCSNKFEGRSNKRFCSRNCKQYSKDIRLGRNNKHLNSAVRYKKDKCEKCGFIPISDCQLDVDHIDGNRNNNHESNLQTLCANCHRLKTYLNKDWFKINNKN